MSNFVQFWKEIKNGSKGKQISSFSIKNIWERVCYSRGEKEEKGDDDEDDESRTQHSLMLPISR